MLLRHLRGAFPHLATEPLWDNGFPNDAGDCVLEPAPDFAQVLPRRTPTFQNPTHVLDYRRFGSDTLLRLLEEKAIADLSPGVPVTTNFMTMTGFRLLDYHQWARHQDVVSTDHYRVATLPDPTAELSFQGVDPRSRRW